MRSGCQWQGAMLSCFFFESWSDSSKHDSLAERSKAVRSGRIPKGRGFESHRCHEHFLFFSFLGYPFRVLCRGLQQFVFFLGCCLLL